MKKVLLLFGLLVAGGGMFAQEKVVQAFSLKEAVDYAIQNNNSVKNARLDEQKAKAYNWEILTQGLPQLAGSFEYDYYFKTPLVPAVSNIVAPGSPFSESLNQLRQNSNDPALVSTLNGLSSGFTNISFVLPNDISTGITLTQLLFDARYMFGIRARKDLYKASRLTTEVTEQEIRYNVTKAYCQAETAEESKSLLSQNLKLIQKLVDDTKVVVQQGLTDEVDVDRLELAQTTLESQINLQNQLAIVGLANLKFQMGLPLDQEIILKDKLTDLRNSADIGKSAEMAFDPQSRPEYNLLNTAITLKGYDVAQKRSGYYPSIAGFLNYSGNVQTQEFSDMFKGSNWYPQGIVGLKINIPIFDSGLKMAQVKQAKFEQMKSRNDFENFKNAAKLQYQAALEAFNAAVIDEANTQKTMSLSQKIFDRNQTKFKLGAGSSFELTQSEQDLATNQLKHMQSIMNLLNAKADLDKAMGIK